MPAFYPIRWPFLSFLLVASRFVALLAQPVSLFSIQGFTADSGTDFALLGDAKPAKGGSRVDLTTDSSPSAGTLVFKKSLKLIDAKSRKPVSFSSDFVFSIGHGDGLAFVIVPEGDHSQIFGQGTFGISKDLEKLRGRIIAVEFGTRKDARGGHVGVDVGRFVSDESKDVLLLDAGEKLQSWVDYEANSKRLEIRLNKFGRARPYNPLISFSVDLLRIWGEREVLLGIGSSSQDSAQFSSVYSWSFRVGTVPNGLHSMPLDPLALDDKKNKKGNCALRILGGVIFATGCGTLVAFFILLLWVVFSSRNLAVTTPEIPMKHLDFNYQKLDVHVDDQSHISRMS